MSNTSSLTRQPERRAQAPRLAAVSQSEGAGKALAERRLALFCTNFLPYSQVFVFEQLRHYRRYQPDIFAWRRFNPEQFPFPRVHLAEPGYVIRGKSRRFSRLFAQGGYDVVHAHFGPAGVYANRFARRHSLPLIVTFHGYDVPLLESRRRFLPLHLPYTLGSGAMLRDMRIGLCASLELKRLLIQHGVSEQKLLVHRLGIDVQRFTPGAAEREPLVVMIGRLVEKKGFEYGLRAFAHARARVTSARLVIVGDGERRRPLERLAFELGIRASVRFAGVQSQAEIAELLQRASVLLAPSVVARDGNRESGLIVAKEASACGAVPIGSEHGGIPESIESGKTGFLVAERDWLSMGQCLSNLLQNSALRAQMAADGRRKMEREFDNRRLVAALEELYDEVRLH